MVNLIIVDNEKSLDSEVEGLGKKLKVNGRFEL